MIYDYEYTDTYGGETNYCWVKKGKVNADNLKLALRYARNELGMRGVRGKITGEFGDEIWWTPNNCCTVLMVRWGDD
jgi:hypothetical protein